MAAAVCPRAAAWAAWISDPASQANIQECKTPAAMPGFLFGQTTRMAPATQLTPKSLLQRYGDEETLCSLGYPCYAQDLRKYTFVCVDNFKKKLARESQTEPTVPFLLAQSSV